MIERIDDVKHPDDLREQSVFVLTQSSVVVHLKVVLNGTEKRGYGVFLDMHSAVCMKEELASSHDYQTVVTKTLFKEVVETIEATVGDGMMALLLLLERTEANVWGGRTITLRKDHGLGSGRPL